MSSGPKADTLEWRPSASLETLRLRGEVLRKIREFFHARGVWEVQTPLLVPAVAPERHQTPPKCQGGYLQSSPETYMKRLLVAGSGAIYQLGSAFRLGEYGPLHHPEFTMLEWYRPGWSLQQLMQEVHDLVATMVPMAPPTILTFQEAFRYHLKVDPLTSPLEDLVGVIGSQPPVGADRAILVDLLMVERLQPIFSTLEGPVFLTGFPAWEPGMAQLDPGPPEVAMRFELFIRGVEIANGYKELLDAREQAERLEKTNLRRQKDGLSALPLDRGFLTALEAGLPPCSGVALGLDRLLMVLLNKTHISQVMAFCPTPDVENEFQS